MGYLPRGNWIIERMGGRIMPDLHAYIFPNGGVVSMLALQQCNGDDERINLILQTIGNKDAENYKEARQSVTCHYMDRDGNIIKVKADQMFIPDHDRFGGHRYTLEALEGNQALYVEQ